MLRYLLLLQDLITLQYVIYYNLMSYYSFYILHYHYYLNLLTANISYSLVYTQTPRKANKLYTIVKDIFILGMSWYVCRIFQFYLKNGRTDFCPIHFLDKYTVYQKKNPTYMQSYIYIDSQCFSEAFLTPASTLCFRHRLSPTKNLKKV